MKTLVLLFAAGLFFTSCISYQYLSITPVPGPSNQTQQTLTDSNIEVTFSFSQLNALLWLNIKNISAQPVHINWKKSAIIENGNTISLFSATVPFAAAAVTDTAKQQGYAATAVYGQAFFEDDVNFIPPQAFISKKTIAAVAQALPVAFTQNDILPQKDINGNTKKFTGKIYNGLNSPCKIRVYLTYTAGSNEKAIEKEFYISQILETTATPETMEIFYNQKPLIFKYK